MKSMKVWIFAGLALAGFAGVAAAQPHRGDILLQVQNNQLTTGRILSDGTLESGVRVFTTTLGLAFPHFTDSPGFDCPTGTFAPGSRNGFRLLDALRKWNGSDFSEVSPSLMEIDYSTLSVTTPATLGVQEGFGLLVSSNGEWHRHLEYTQLDPAEPGVYMLMMQIYSDAGPSESDPFWMIFGDNADADEVEAAAAWARCNFLGDCPCDADVNHDGNQDQGDIDYLINIVAGGENPTGVDPDFNHDGNADQSDIDSIVNVIAGGACP